MTGNRNSAWATIFGFNEMRENRILKANKTLLVAHCKREVRHSQIGAKNVNVFTNLKFEINFGVNSLSFSNSYKLIRTPFFIYQTVRIREVRLYCYCFSFSFVFDSQSEMCTQRKCIIYVCFMCAHTANSGCSRRSFYRQLSLFLKKKRIVVDSHS